MISNQHGAPTAPSSFVGLFAAFIVAIVTACPSAPVVPAGTCKSDLDCGASETCNVPRGQCICIDDNACDSSEFCNAAGGCQLKLECLNNNDCRNDGNPSAICDTTTGGCLTLSASVQCVLDSQCPYGTYCDSNECTPGCQDNGDCNLGDPCINGQCDATPGACNQNSFCEFGQLCGTDNRCRDHALRDQLCSTCNPNDFGGGTFCFDSTDCAPGETCDEDLFTCVGGAGGAGCGQDDCLIDSSVQPTVCTSDNDCDRGTCETDAGNPGRKICQGFFCGASDCNDVTNPCPRGYSCFTLQIVSGAQCDLNNANSCQGGRACNGGGENGNVGFCSCVDDGDCGFSGATCVNPGPRGSCVIGTTCGPSDGLLCEDLR